MRAAQLLRVMWQLLSSRHQLYVSLSAGNKEYLYEVMAINPTFLTLPFRNCRDLDEPRGKTKLSPP